MKTQTPTAIKVRSAKRRVSRKERAALHLIEQSLQEMMNPAVDLKACITPPGGWEALEARVPGFWSLSRHDQMRITIYG